MGSWVSHLIWGADPDLPHPVSGLTLRDVHRVQKTWAPLYANCVHSGVELFKRLFRLQPDTKEYFKMVKDLPEEELESSAQFRAHVINLMTAFNSVVENLNQPEVMVHLARKIAISHWQKNVKPQHFVGVKEVMVGMFLEAKMDEATLTSWSKTIDFWFGMTYPILEGGPDTR